MESKVGDRLDSWKEIASYLKQGVRTAQRWEKEEQLPVHRHSSRKRGTVFAFRSELDAWWESRGEPIGNDSTARQRVGMRVSIAAALAALLGLALWGGWESAPTFDEAMVRELAATLHLGQSAVSPDEQWLAYTEPENGFLRLRKLGDASSDELLVPHPILGSPIWSRDSDRVAIVTRNPEEIRIALVELDGQEQVLWSGLARERLEPVGFFPDGRLLCHFVRGSRVGQLVVFPETHQESLPRVPSTARQVRLSPDGLRVAYSLSSDGSWDIWVQELAAGSTPRQISHDRRADNEPTWLNDGQYVLAVRGWDSDPEQDLIALPVDPERGPEIRLGTPPDIYAGRGISLSDRGNLFAAVGRETASAVLLGWDPIREEPNRTVHSDFPAYSWFNSWTSDGRLVYSSFRLSGATQNNRPVMLARSPGGADELYEPPRRRVVELLPAKFRRVAYRLGDPWGFAAEEGSNRIVQFDPETLETRPLLELADPVAGLRSRQGGSRLIATTYSVERNQWTIFMIHPAEGSLKRIASTRLKPSPEWSPIRQELAFSDANCLLVASGEGDRLEEIYCTSGTSLRLPEPGQPVSLEQQILWGTVMEAHWSPDGNWILWSAPMLERRRVDLLAVHRDSKRQIRLWAGGENYESAARGADWSPDGKWVGFTLEQFPPTQVWAVRGLRVEPSATALAAWNGRP